MLSPPRGNLQVDVVKVERYVSYDECRISKREVPGVVVAQGESDVR